VAELKTKKAKVKVQVQVRFADFNDFCDMEKNMAEVKRNTKNNKRFDSETNMPTSQPYLHRSIRSLPGRLWIGKMSEPVARC
jgi:hypothetical protein